MSFGKRAEASRFSPPVASAPRHDPRVDELRAVARTTGSKPVKVAAGPPQDPLVDELRAMARTTGSKQVKVYGTIDGRLVDESDPVLARRDGVTAAVNVRRGDYWIANLLGNLSAVAGFGGGLWLGLAAQGAIGVMFGVWGLTAVITGRLLITPFRGGIFRGDQAEVYMGRAARLMGLGLLATGAWMIVHTWHDPSPFADVMPHFKSPLHGFYGHP